jgi:hypothetical protein
VKLSSRFFVATISGLCLVSPIAYSEERVTDPFAASNYVITYYDRNDDGKVDFELHELPNGADTDWALIDTTFRGRYDLRIQWGFVVEKEHVDLPVPKNVKITPGKPPKYIDMGARRSNHTMETGYAWCQGC